MRSILPRAKWLNVSGAALAAALMVTSAGNAHAASLFWAINNFQTIQELDGDTGAVVNSFAVPLGAGSAASIAFVGNTGYYTLLGNSNIYTVDMTTHLSGGVAFNIGATAGLTNGITTDAGGNLWFADGNAGALKQFNTSGTLLSTHAFPTSAAAYRDGSAVFGNMIVANRGDQTGPYDLYTIPGGNGALTLTQAAFINPAINGQNLFGSNGIAFNGVNFYTSDEQAHRVSKWDSNGAFISFAALDPGSRYENWTFAAQDIVGGAVPEPATWAMMLVGFGFIGATMRRKQRQAVRYNFA